MKVSVDTNLLVRVITHDDSEQATIAGVLLRDAELVAISLPCLCEFVWVLGSIYGLSRADAALAVRKIIERANVVTDHAAATAGLRMLDAGGDFADGAIAAASVTLGGEIFVSFDRKAVMRANAMGIPAKDARQFK